MPAIGCLVPVVVGVVAGRVIGDLANPQDLGGVPPAAGKAIAVGDAAREWEDALAAFSAVGDRSEPEGRRLDADQHPKPRRGPMVDLDKGEIPGRSCEVRCPQRDGVLGVERRAAAARADQATETS